MRVGASVVAVLGALIAVPAFAPTPAHAEYATNGASPYVGSVDWFTLPASTTWAASSGSHSVTNTRNIGADTLVTTCTLNNITGTGKAGDGVKSYAPGTGYSGDGWDEQFNKGAANASSGDMTVGIANANSDSASFDFACSLTLNGAAVPLPGLVLADAESTNTTGNESWGATPCTGPVADGGSCTPSTATTWRLLGDAGGHTNFEDVYLTDPSGSGTSMSLGGATTATVKPNSLEVGGFSVDGKSHVPDAGQDESSGNKWGPATVWFMEGATAAHVTVTVSSSTQAVAVGAIIPVDFGDAPDSYGAAGALLLPTFSGAQLTAGYHTISVKPSSTGTGAVTNFAGIDGVDTSICTPAAGTMGCDYSLNADGSAVTTGNGDKTGGTTKTAYASFHVAAMSLPSERLGSALDADSFSTDSSKTAHATNAGVSALGDDTNGSDDEDGIAGNTSVSTVEVDDTSDFTSPAISCTGDSDNPADPNSSAGSAIYPANVGAANTGYLAGWVDWNDNGSFDADEAANGYWVDSNQNGSQDADEPTVLDGDTDHDGVIDNGETLGHTLQSAPCAAAGSQVHLIWQKHDALPLSLAPGDHASYLRLRLGPTPASVTIPSGVSLPGEVEDYPITLHRPALTLGLSVAGTWLDDGNGTAGTAGDHLAQAGEHIRFTYTVTNTGERDLGDVTVTDARGLTITCAQTVLEVEASTTCTADYPLTDADLGGTTLNEAATASGVFQGAVVDAPSAASTATPLALHEHLAVDVKASVKHGATLLAASADHAVVPSSNAAPVVGDTVVYSYTITNTGDASGHTLTGIALTTSGASLASAPSCSTTLSLGASTTCTAMHTITQADLDGGSHFEATAYATGTYGSASVSSDSDTADAVVPRLTVALTGPSPATLAGARAGDPVGFKATITNTGDVTLGALAPTAVPLGCTTVGLSATHLAPGAQVQATCAYPLTQSDIDAGSITATLSANGSYGDTTVTAGPANATVTVTASKSLGLTIAGAWSDASGGHAGYPDAGETATFTYRVTNTGDVTVHSVAISGLTYGTNVVAPSSTTLAPGGSAEFTAAHTLTQGEIDSGSLVEHATATATGGIGSGDQHGTLVLPPVRQITAAVSNATVNQASSSASATADRADAGDTITYTYSVHNAGNVALAEVAVHPTRGLTPHCAATTLRVGESTTCTATTAALTQAEVDGDAYTETVIATGTSESSTVTSAADERTVQLADKSLTLRITAVSTRDSNDNGWGDAGDTILYTYAVTDSGNVDVAGVTVNGKGAADTDSVPAAQDIAVGKTVSFQSRYRISAADVVAGTVHARAVATGRTAAVGPISSNVDQNEQSLGKVTAGVKPGTPTTSVQGVPVAEFPPGGAGQNVEIVVTAPPGSTASCVLTSPDHPGPQVTVRAVQTSPGDYTCSIPTGGLSGRYTVTITVSEPNGSTVVKQVPIYIDPSGTVVDGNGVQVVGSRVTLQHAPRSGGSANRPVCTGLRPPDFTTIPDGSLLMSATNRTNPVTTAADGAFSWEVQPGCYLVSARVTHCGKTYTGRSSILTVPPRHVDVTIALGSLDVSAACASASRTDLASTGSPLLQTVSGGLGLVGLGALVLVGGRRRRRGWA